MFIRPITRVRNRRELNASLKGTTLGDADGDADDTLKWLRRSAKREKELAKKRQDELEQMDKMFQQEYSERELYMTRMYAHVFSSRLGDLEGLKVSHDFDELNEGEGRVLTLKDSRILDNEGKSSSLARESLTLIIKTEDELQNVEMAEAAKGKKNQELKIKRRDYTGYDDEEFTEGNQGMKRAVLSKYDEFLEGPRETVGVTL
jgi:U4/U6.U5 tri-snRNP-associated protein 1